MQNVKADGTLAYVSKSNKYFESKLKPQDYPEGMTSLPIFFAEPCIDDPDCIEVYWEAICEEDGTVLPYFICDEKTYYAYNVKSHILRYPSPMN